MPSGEPGSEPGEAAAPGPSSQGGWDGAAEGAPLLLYKGSAGGFGGASGGIWRRLLNQRVGLAAGEFDTGCKNMKPGPFIINAEILEEILLCLVWTELTPHSYAEALPPMWCFEVGPLGGNQVWGDPGGGALVVELVPL